MKIRRIKNNAHMLFETSVRLCLFWDEGKVGTYKQLSCFARILKKVLETQFNNVHLEEYPVVSQISALLQFKKSPKHQFTFILTSGRRAFEVGFLLRCITYFSKNRYCFIALLNPRQWLFVFDFALVPLHDSIKESTKIFSYPGALHDISSSIGDKREDVFWPFKEQRLNVVVLLGGDSRHYTYREEEVLAFIRKLKTLSSASTYLLITPSRRTPSFVLELLRKHLVGYTYWIWDGRPPNPYIALLDHADLIVLTSDSVNMQTEACATQVPRFIWELPLASKRLCLLTEYLLSNGYAYSLKSCENFTFERMRCLDSAIGIEEWVSNTILSKM